MGHSEMEDKSAFAVQINMMVQGFSFGKQEVGSKKEPDRELGGRGVIETGVGKMYKGEISNKILMAQLRLK